MTDEMDSHNGLTLPELEVPESGVIFTFGKSKFAENAPSKFWIKKDLITQISCGDEHTAVVTHSGRLFTFGSNEWGQLGLGHNESVIKPSCVKALKPDKVILVACGKSHTIVYMESGRLLAFGSNADGQLGVGRTPEFTNRPLEITNEVIKEEVAQLAAGFSHTMALGQDSGQVYVWGNNVDGQLGLGEDAPETFYEPTLLEFSSRISQISCGYHHSAFITSPEGFLYVFGDGDDGKLGQGSQGADSESFSCDEPSKVNLPEKAVMVACGGSHTVVLTDVGHVYSFGLSTNGQLGLGTSILSARDPTLITSLANHFPGKLVHISCGENHTAVVSEDGHVFMFGDGRHGKLCLDVETMTNHFTPVYPSRFQGFQVQTAKCGGCHTMVFALPIPGYDFEKPLRDGINEALLENGHLDEDANPNARQIHRDSNQEKRLLPPIKPRQTLPSDPNEILHVGSDIIKVNGDESGPGYPDNQDESRHSAVPSSEEETDNVEDKSTKSPNQEEDDGGNTEKNGSDDQTEEQRQDDDNEGKTETARDQSEPETKTKATGKLTNFFSSLGVKKKSKATKPEQLTEAPSKNEDAPKEIKAKSSGDKVKNKKPKTVRFFSRSRADVNKSEESLQKSSENEDEAPSQGSSSAAKYKEEPGMFDDDDDNDDDDNAKSYESLGQENPDDNLEEESADDLNSSTRSMPNKPESHPEVREAFIDLQDSTTQKKNNATTNHEKAKSKTCILI
ncbi:X-linked retinitis pigmentosa GTPase regulator-like [Tigriopus californicus]|nr:X-linked retinitis pigmentosa GTPase regulator-like [Tigriopus californicus]